MGISYGAARKSSMALKTRQAGRTNCWHTGHGSSRPIAETCSFRVVVLFLMTWRIRRAVRRALHPSRSPRHPSSPEIAPLPLIWPQSVGPPEASGAVGPGSASPDRRRPDCAGSGLRAPPSGVPASRRRDAPGPQLDRGRCQGRLTAPLILHQIPGLICLSLPMRSFSITDWSTRSSPHRAF